MRRGFTLIELVVVILLLGIVAGVSVPALARRGEDDALAAAAGDVVGLLGRARRTALERGRSVTLALDPASGRYQVRLTGESGDVVAEGTLALAGGVQLEAGHTGAAWVHVVFSPLGAAEGGPVIVRRGGRAAVVALDRWTGEASVRRP